MNRTLAIVAGILGVTGVMLGAFGAHGVKNLVENLPDAADRLRWWDTGAKYHLVHALAVGLTAVLADRVPGRLPRIAAWSFVVGVLLFSGSLYVMTLTGTRALGLITPFGGLSMMAGWTCFTVAAVRLPRPA